MEDMNNQMQYNNYVCNNKNTTNNNNNTNTNFASEIELIIGGDEHECENKNNCTGATIEKTETETDVDANANARMPLNMAAPISKVFIDDLTEHKRVWRIPWFIVNMCLVQISIHVIANDCIYQRLMFIPGHRTEYWRYLTYMLLHSDLLHLMMNLCLQCLIGFCLECEQGHWKVAFIYAAGGVSGSLATERFQPQLSLLGASAGIYAMLMSHIPHLIKNFSRLPHRFLRIVALAILCLSDIGFTTFHIVVNGNTNPRICLEAHIAGGICGLCLGFLVYRRSALCCVYECGGGGGGWCGSGGVACNSRN